MVSRQADQFPVRLPLGMRARIKAAAAANHRSMNSEIVTHLERAFPAPQAATGEEIGVKAPAAAPDEAALPGGPIHHQRL